jgi:tetratricopeptide (TPR) repeat protein
MTVVRLVMALAVAGAATALAGAMRAPPDAAPEASPSPPGIENAYRANNRGVALLEQYRYEDAAAAFRAALLAEPSLGIARANLAIALLNLPKPEEARVEAAAAARAVPSLPQAPYVLGLAARASGDAKEAEAAFRRVLALDPRDVGAHVNVGQTLMQDRRYTEAVTEFRAALEAEPYSSTAAYNLGLALARSGDAAGSRDAMERFRQLREGGYGTSLGQA